MIAPINPITLADPALSIQSPTTFPASGAESNGGGSFKTMLDSAVNAVQGSQNNADTAIENFLNGNTEDVHSTVLAVQRADLTFQMFMQLRNKVVSAYQEVMKMQV
jgi:flagellar hook-basal body complex protein FliE